MKFNKKNMIEAVQRKLNQYTEHGLKSDAEALLFQAILLHLQSAVMVPEGWRLMPCEATEEMHAAFDKCSAHAFKYSRDDRKIFEAGYAGALAAAPDYREE